jgi:S-adenosylmethionine:tRNA ribosyltransferase-isomerase
MDVTDFHFELPGELIAQEAAPRGASRLLVLDRTNGRVQHSRMSDLPSILRRGDLLVVNNTRVFAARLLGHRVPSGGAVECLLLERPDADRASPHQGARLARALMHPGQKLKPGALVRFQGAAGVLMAEVLERHFYGQRTIRLWAESGPDVDALIDALGHVPLPPYITRGDTMEDRERYQTVFARIRGSIAAPTAGLHFDDTLLARLAERGIERAEITLHVGYGTFKPVRVERVEDHAVDPEQYEIPEPAAAALERARTERRRVIAVGTTTTRALEDAAIRGNGRVNAGAGTASLFIYPGHQFRVIDGLLTNFHLPASSLLMLVAAFAGRERVLAAYREAVAQRYRFYSYGDAMLIA